MTTKPVLLIDGDMYLYSATLAAEVEVRWDDQNHVLFSNAEEAYDLFLAQLNTVSAELGSDDYRIAFTVGDSFRKEVYPAYKETRKVTRKPMCFKATRDRVMENFKCLIVEGLEADDVLGIWATKNDGKHKIIVSGDKDLQTIPGWLFRQGELREVTQEQADYFWMLQTLMGDKTDGYTGLVGYGPKTAEKVLAGGSNLAEWWQLVLLEYYKKEKTFNDALVMARLARILRSEDWDTIKKEVKLWTPPST